VAAGEIVMREAKKNNVQLMPIDSEHSALFQCLNGENKKTIKSLVITCSGGALRDHSKEELKKVSIKEALGHKTWAMGQKITIDSATLMNKGFEVIEAMWLYDVKPENIQVVIHPESLIHSMIEFSDNSIIAQISEPDMKLPIQYALSYPDRWDEAVKRHHFDRSYTFKKPDLDRFPCLGYAWEAMKVGGTLPAVMNAANDTMVAKFLNGQCKYLDIPKIIKKVMDSHKATKNPTLNDIEKAIDEAIKLANQFTKN
jgi:1-deoxy-D-xylulose-5-phosphate reductoisomerase